MKKFIFLLLVFFLLGLWVSIFRDFWKPDEEHFATVTYTMLHTGDFLTLHYLNQPYYEKPPFYFWLMAGSAALFKSFQPVVLRWPALLSALLLLVMLFRFVRRENQEGEDSFASPYGPSRIQHEADKALLPEERGPPGQGYVSLLFPYGVCAILGSMLLFFIGAELVRMDMLMTLFATLAFFFFYRGFWASDRKFRYYFWFYVCLSLAVLVKGFAGFALPFVAALAVMGVERRWSEFKKLRLPLGFLIFLLPLAAWFAAAWHWGTPNPQGKNPIQIYVIDQTLNRILASQTEGSAHTLYHFTHYHPQPFYFYFLVFWGCVFPWTFLALEAVLYAFRRFRTLPRLIRGSLLWFLSGIAALSVSGGKLPLYTLPLTIPVAILSGYLFDLKIRSGNGTWAKRHLLLVQLFFLLILPALYVTLHNHASGEPFSLVPLFSLAAVGGVISLLLLFFYFRHTFRSMGYALTAEACAFIALFSWGFLPPLNSVQGYGAFAHVVQKQCGGKFPAMAYAWEEGVELTPYLKENVEFTDSPETLQTLLEKDQTCLVTRESVLRRHPDLKILLRHHRLYSFPSSQYPSFILVAPK